MGAVQRQIISGWSYFFRANKRRKAESRLHPHTHTHTHTHIPPAPPRPEHITLDTAHNLIPAQQIQIFMLKPVPQKAGNFLGGGRFARTCVSPLAGLLGRRRRGGEG
jgi:hypothetical protein